MLSVGGVCDGDEPDPWKSFLTSTLTFTAEVAGGGVEVEAGVAEPLDEGAFDIEALPFTWPAAGTDPNDLTFSVLTAGAGGEEDGGAESSSIDPKVTAEPYIKQ